jgi:GNAT superfamily N-acetyltransferase
MSTFAVRRFAESDTDRVVELSIAAWAPVFASFERVFGGGLYRRLHPDWRKEQEATVRAALGRHDTWVAAVDGVALGFVTVVFDDEARSGEIYLLAVDPSAQRRGVAAKLVDRAFDEMRARGITVAIVATGGDDGHAPARTVYERAGFTGCPQVWYAKELV